MKKYFAGAITVLVLALFIVVGALGGQAAVAAPTVNAGQFCGYHDRGDTKTASNGDTVRCEKVGHVWKWVKVVAPSGSSSTSQSASASASASSSASASASATASSSTSATPSSTPPVTSSSSLPLTGAKPGLIALVGLLLVAGGAGLFVAARRRTRFTA